MISLIILVVACSLLAVIISLSLSLEFDLSSEYISIESIVQEGSQLQIKYTKKEYDHSFQKLNINSSKWETPNNEGYAFRKEQLPEDTCKKINKKYPETEYSQRLLGCNNDNMFYYKVTTSH